MNNFDKKEDDQSKTGQKTVYSGSKNIITIQTHDKKFHADDVGTLSLLTSYYNQKNIKINLIRSRDTSLMDDADILVDVGNVYDHETGRYDHHQVSFTDTFSDTCKIPLSSIGIIWKHYGKEILEMYIDAMFNAKNYDMSDKNMEELHSTVYFNIIQEIDGIDNGINPIEGGKRKFWVNLDLSSIISSMNTEDPTNDDEQMLAFQKAIDFFGMVFDIKLQKIIPRFFNFLDSYDKVVKLLDEIPFDQEYLIINDDIPMFYKCLSKIDYDERIKILIYENETECVIKTRSTKNDKFKPICPLVSLNILENKLMKESIIFIHKNLFLAKTETLKSAIELTEESLKNHKRKLLEQAISNASKKHKQSDNIIQKKHKNDFNSNSNSDPTSSFNSKINDYLPLIGIAGGSLVGLYIASKRDN